MGYVVVFIFIVGVIFLLSKLKPIGAMSNVDWNEYKKCQSMPERLMFQELAKMNLYIQCQKKVGHKFRCDFYLNRYRCFIEVDGIHHDLPEQKRRDREKDALVESMGLQMIRIKASDVVKNPHEALIKVLHQTGIDYDNYDEWAGQGV